MKTLIFDFDGTIADSFELVLSIAYELTGVRQVSNQEIARLRRLSLLRVIRDLRIPFARLPNLFLRGRQRMHERIHEVRPFPGMPKALNELHASGYHLLVMSSNSEQNVRAFLRANNLESYFDGVYGNVAVFSKAAALRKVMRNNRIEAQHCYYIGDEVRDVVAASKARVEPIAVSWGYQDREALAKYHPSALVSDPKELLNLFNGR